jgi:hypothetical protein
MIEICRNYSGNVKNWQNETMALRWCAASMVEAGKQCRRSTVPVIIGAHADNLRSPGHPPMWPIGAL